MKIGIYGGTFNPIHLGHMAAAKFAIEYLKLDKLYLVPVGIPPHKELAEGTPAPRHRQAMAELAGQALGEHVEVLDLELRRQGKSYTTDTVRAIQKQHPKDHLYLLMGTDMFLTFQNWRHPEEIAKRCTLCAFGRSEADTEALFAPQRAYLHEKYSADVVTIVLPEIVDISSTQLREKLCRGDGNQFLLPAVYGYILVHHLYGTRADLKHLPLELLRPAALSLLDQRRGPHVLGTEETAAKLALRWGANEEDARRAALLHDCTKRLSRSEHLRLCKHYGIRVDEQERKAGGKLLHAKTGAALARDLFGVSEEIGSAIYWHTTGKADMTLLEKIIYLADYIEPTRNFGALKELRPLAYEDLDRAILRGLTIAVEDLSRKGMVLHPNSVRARDYLKGKLL